MKTQTTKADFSYFRTSDTKCASFLIASGHLPMNPPLIHHVLLGGNTKSFWQFADFATENDYGRKVGASIRIWKQGIKFIEANPEDGQGKIMQALKTYEFLTNQLGRDDLSNTLVFYKVGGNTFSAVKGSKKAKMLESKLQK